MSKRKTPIENDKPPKPLARLVVPCDRCGYWESPQEDLLYPDSRPLYESSQYIATASFEIKVNCGSIFLCGHHYRKHEPYLASMGYTIQEIK